MKTEGVDPRTNAPTTGERATGEDLNSLEASLAADLGLLETSSDGDLRLALVRIDALEADLTAVRTRSETELVP